MSTLDFSYYDYLRDAKESGKFIYSIMESFPQGIIITNTENKIIYANPKIAQMTGYSRKELIGKYSHLFLHFPDQQKILQDIIDKRITGIYENYELYVKRKNGSRFLAYTLTSPYKDPDGQVKGTISILTDITIKQQDKELQILASGTAKALNAVLITDKFGRIEWVNEGFTKLTGYELYEVIDTTGEIIRQENNDLFLEKLAEAIRTKKSIAYESRNYKKAGSEYWVSSTLTPVLDEYGSVKEIIIIETDITVHKNSGNKPV
jgi:PAS domain S-box-containing protein